MKQIKSRVQFFLSNNERPLKTIYEHDILIKTLHHTPKDLKIGSIIPTIEGDKYKIVNIVLKIYDEEIEYSEFGFDSSIEGEGMPYNFGIEITIAKI